MILVTGGGGYVGSVLVPDLLAMGFDVRVVDTFWFPNALPRHPRLDLVEADIREADEGWLDDVDAIIHLAGMSNDPTADFAPRLNAELNVQVTRELGRLAVARARRTGSPIRFVYASSCSIYYSDIRGASPDVEVLTEDARVAPTANYSKTKRMAELSLLDLAREEPLFCPVMLRKGTLFGHAPRMRFDLVVNVFTLHAWKHRRLTVHSSGEAWRPLLHVRDAADAYLYCMVSPAELVRGKVYNVLRKNYRVLEIAHWVAEILEEHRGVKVQVARDRGISYGNRSYYVSGERIARDLGFRAERGTTKAVLEIWDNLEQGVYGEDPTRDPVYFNIRWFEQRGIRDDRVRPMEALVGVGA